MLTKFSLPQRRRTRQQQAFLGYKIVDEIEKKN